MLALVLGALSDVRTAFNRVARFVFLPRTIPRLTMCSWAPKHISIRFERVLSGASLAKYLITTDSAMGPVVGVQYYADLCFRAIALGGVALELSSGKAFRILAPGSLRRSVAFSLAIVRLILVPVIFLAIFYLFRMGSIVDRIVNLDAPAARLAEQSSVAMLEARRAERNYFLLRDPAYLKSNAEALTQLKQLLARIRDLDSSDKMTAQEALSDVGVYERQFGAAVSFTQSNEDTPVRHIQGVVRTYETDLNHLLQRGRHETQVQLVEQLHGWADSFDTEVARAAESGDPTLRQVTRDLQASSQKVLHLSSTLETLSWVHIQRDHAEAQNIIRRAKWILSIVSGLTLILSIWISFVLPRRVIKPLMDLKEAVDHAAAGNYEIAFDLHGEGELLDLTNSVRKLILHVQQQGMRHVPAESGS